MSTQPSASATQHDSRQLASHWHTAALVGVILAVAVTGTLLQRSGSLRALDSADRLPENGRIVGQYLPMLLVNWGLTLYVARLFRARNALPVLLGRGWRSLGQAGADLSYALGACVLVALLELLSARYLGVGRNVAVYALLPRSEAERLTWVLVALSVGFCEEVVYRGYLQTQLAAFTGRSSTGIVLQAILFGAAHADQGAAAALRIAAYGLVLGILVQARRSLWPAITCHIAIDVASGLLHR